MGGWLYPPAPGTAGTVITSARLGALLAYASPAGPAVAAAPPGFNGTVGRLNVSLAAGNATWISLTAGASGQLVALRNVDAANTLFLTSAGFEFASALGNYSLPPGTGIMLCWDTTNTLWEVL